MVEPRPQQAAPTGRYSGVKEQPLRNWDRNKARMESIYQLPMRDFRQTAAQFGVPPSVADITTTEKGIPKMECTTTTKSDFCAPSLDRYIKVQGVCPERDYPSSSGLEYCPGRESEVKPAPPMHVPIMPRTRSTCPASLESVLPKIGPVPQLKYPPSVPQFPSTWNGDPSTPSPYSRRFEVEESKQPDNYAPNVDYLSARKGYKWPVPTEQLHSHRVQDREIQNLKSVETKEDVEGENVYINKNFEDNNSKLQDDDGYRNYNEQTLEYPVEDNDHLEKRKLHDAMLERARREYEQKIGVPGSTVPLVKAGVDPPNSVAHYNVPDYTQGSPAGGMIRSRFGVPNRDMKIPITDPSYPKPEYKIPQPEAGLTKSGYSEMLNGDKTKAGIAHTPPLRYPDKIYNTARYTEPDKVEASSHAGGGAADRYISSIIEAQDNLIPTPTQQIIQPYEDRMEWTQHSGEPPTETTSEKPKVESQTMKGLRRIQTSNQVYGSWIDDPYLKDNDWWFKARPKNPRTKTYLSRYKEENAWQ